MENYIQQNNPLETFKPSGNDFFDSKIIEKRDKYDLFWKENTDNVDLSIPKKLEKEIEILEFFAELYKSIKESGKTYEEHISEIPNFEDMLEQEFQLSKRSLGWPGEIKDEFMKINKE